MVASNVSPTIAATLRAESSFIGLMNDTRLETTTANRTFNVKATLWFRANTKNRAALSSGPAGEEPCQARIYILRGLRVGIKHFSRFSAKYRSFCNLRIVTAETDSIRGGVVGFGFGSFIKWQEGARVPPLVSCLSDERFIYLTAEVLQPLSVFIFAILSAA